MGARRGAFVRAELTAVVVVVALATSLLTIASDHARRESRVAGSMSNLKRFASGIGAFGADNEDRIVSFWWRAGESHQDPGGYTYPTASSDSIAGSYQAVSVIRRLGDRSDVQVISSWVAHILYNHLALADYLQERVPAEHYVSPSDHNRLAWVRATVNMPASDQGQAFFQLVNRPSYPSSGNNEKRWPYSSSYQFVPASYSPDARILTAQGTIIPTVSQDPTGHRFYTVGNNLTPFGRRRVSEIAHPSNKVLIFEQHAGDLGVGRYFYAYDRVRAPMLFGDGSVSVRSMTDANQGFQPNSPFTASPTRVNYKPELLWEPPTMNGGPEEIVNGRVQWTRSGLRGRDFGGPEVAWVD